MDDLALHLLPGSRHSEEACSIGFSLCRMDAKHFDRACTGHRAETVFRLDHCRSLELGSHLPANTVPETAFELLEGSQECPTGVPPKLFRRTDLKSMEPHTILRPRASPTTRPLPNIHSSRCFTAPLAEESLDRAFNTQNGTAIKQLRKSNLNAAKTANGQSTSTMFILRSM